VPETAATSVHVVNVSLHGAFPPVWRRLELPSAMTLDRLHEIVQGLFGWDGFHLHVFETAYGEFGSPSSYGSSDRSDEAAVALAQVAGGEGTEIVYVYDFGDDWRHDIVVEKIMPAGPGVAYEIDAEAETEMLAPIAKVSARGGGFPADAVDDPHGLFLGDRDEVVHRVAALGRVEQIRELPYQITREHFVVLSLVVFNAT
jgi:hypothetical protein